MARGPPQRHPLSSPPRGTSGYTAKRGDYQMEPRISCLEDRAARVQTATRVLKGGSEGQSDAGRGAPPAPGFEGEGGAQAGRAASLGAEAQGSEGFSPRASRGNRAPSTPSARWGAGGRAGRRAPRTARAHVRLQAAKSALTSQQPRQPRHTLRKAVDSGRTGAHAARAVQERRRSAEVTPWLRTEPGPDLITQASPTSSPLARSCESSLPGVEPSGSFLSQGGRTLPREPWSQQVFGPCWVVWGGSKCGVRSRLGAQQGGAFLRLGVSLPQGRGAAPGWSMG